MGMAKAFAWALYDHLWAVIGLNMLWALLSLPWFGLAALVASLALNLGGELALPGAIGGLLLSAELVLFAPPGLLLFLAGRHWAHDRPVEFRALLREARPLALRAQLLGLVVGGGTLVLLVNVLFYQRLGGWLGLILSGTMLWLLVALLLSAVFLFPVLLSLDGRLWAVLRQSLLLALDNPGLAAGLLVAGLAFLGVGALTGVGIFAGALSALALLFSVVFRRLCQRYNGEEPPAERPRQWRELIRPWE